ncbi:dioxygenase [Halomonas denitrificans]|nr:dioxygenase [Halomonas denitrificans]
MLPSLFVSHGAPTFALDPGAIGHRLTMLGRQLARPRAVVVVSAHWQTDDLRVTGHPAPPTIHDFRGFDPALREIVYPAPGDPALAALAVDLVSAAGRTARLDPSRGLDHGAWVPLLHLFPDADVPVVQVSLPRTLDGLSAWQLGRALAPLRELDVLVVGSGSLTHGLQDLFDDGQRGRREARAFRSWLIEAISDGDAERLCSGWNDAPGAARAHPTSEHYLPLVVAAAAGGLDEVEVIDGGWLGGVIAMDAIVFGRADRARLSAA